MPAIPFDAEKVSRRFAPRVYFHPEENYLPSSVPWFLKRVRLYHITALHARGVPKPQLMLGKGKVTVNNLSTQSRKGDESWKKRKYGAFYLTIPEDGNEWKTRFGHLPSAKCYCHVQPSKPAGRWWLAYCFFYPFNGSIAKAIEVTHEGDWEHIKVEVDKTGTKLHQIWYAAHGSGKWWPKATANRKGFACVSGTHPIVYSARDSHASYTTNGEQARFPANDYTGRGKLMDCWKNPHFELLGNKSTPSTGQDWLRFGGFWGRLGSGMPEIVPDRGPLGPGYKSWWRDC